MRLAKYLAHAGIASRRRAEELITTGRVTVGSEIVLDPARDVSDRSAVTVDGQAIKPERHVYYMLNKPKGVVSTADDPQGRSKVTDLLPADARLYPVGRLDIDSSGLILLTNDGELANRITHPRYEVEKSYWVVVKGQVSEQAVDRLRKGVRLGDGMTAPAKVRVLERERSRSTLEISIHEGRNRQLRRMCEAVGYPARSLERVRLGPLSLGRLKPGSSRPLTAAEIESLHIQSR